MKFYENINAQTPINKVWTQINTLKNLHIKNKPPLHHVSWVEPFTRSLTPVYLPNNVQVTDNDTTNDRQMLLKFFILQELNLANNNTNSPAGIDIIPYTIWKQMTKIKKDALLNLFNDLWSSGSFPSQWEEHTIVPFLKPNKNPDDLSSYRRIYLSSCVMRTMEK